MSQNDEYENELRSRLAQINLDIPNSEVLVTYRDAIGDLELGDQNYTKIVERLGSPEEFIQEYVNERLGEVWSVSGHDNLIRLVSKWFQEIKSKISSRSIQYVSSNSRVKLLIFLSPLIVVIFTLIFGNWINFRDNNSTYYLILSLPFYMIGYQLFVLVSGVELMSELNARTFRLVYRLTMIFGMLIYIFTPFDYKGSLDEWHDLNQGVDGTVRISGPYEIALPLWLVTLILFELFELLILRIQKTSFSTSLQDKEFLQQLYLGLFFTILIGSMVEMNEISSLNIMTLGIMGLLVKPWIKFNEAKVQAQSTNRRLKTVIKNLIEYRLVLIGLISGLLGLLQSLEGRNLSYLKLSTVFVILIVQTRRQSRRISRTASVSQKYVDSHQIIEDLQMKLNESYLGKFIRISFLLGGYLLGSIAESYDDDPSWTFFGLVMVSLILFVGIEFLVERPHNAKRLNLQLLSNNRFLLFGFLLMTYSKINSFANFYEFDKFDDRYPIDYGLAYASLIANALIAGLVLVHFQNRQIARSNGINRGWQIIIVIIAFELFVHLFYLYGIAFRGGDASFFKSSETEILTGLVIYILVQLIPPLLNSLINVRTIESVNFNMPIV